MKNPFDLHQIEEHNIIYEKPVVIPRTQEICLICYPHKQNQPDYQFKNCKMHEFLPEDDMDNFSAKFYADLDDPASLPHPKR